MRFVKKNHAIDCILHIIPLILPYLVAGCFSENHPLLDDIPLQPLISVGYTYQRSDGNRVASGRGKLPTAEQIDVPLPGQRVRIPAAGD